MHHTKSSFRVVLERIQTRTRQYLQFIPSSSFRWLEGPDGLIVLHRLAAQQLVAEARKASLAGVWQGHGSSLAVSFGEEVGLTGSVVPNFEAIAPKRQLLCFLVGQPGDFHAPGVGFLSFRGLPGSANEKKAENYADCAMTILNYDLPSFGNFVLYTT